MIITIGKNGLHLRERRRLQSPQTPLRNQHRQKRKRKAIFHLMCILGQSYTTYGRNWDVLL